MKCCYPNCRSSALWTPVIALPTLRTAGLSQAMIECKEPTTLLCREVCGFHKDHYNLEDWIKAGDWVAMQDCANENGYHIPRPEIIPVEFRPIGWTPSRALEVERD